MNITLTIGGRDFSSRLSTYNVKKNVAYGELVTTMDGREHVGKRNETYEITFSLFPSKTANAAADYTALSDRLISVTFTDPYNNGADTTGNFRVANDLESTFGLVNISGDRIYLGNEITLRETAS